MHKFSSKARIRLSLKYIIFCGGRRIINPLLQHQFVGWLLLHVESVEEIVWFHRANHGGELSVEGLHIIARLVKGSNGHVHLVPSYGWLTCWESSSGSAALLNPRRHKIFHEFVYTTFGKYYHRVLLNACETFCYWLSARESKPIAVLY